MTKRGVQWTGDWSEIITWLDELSGGRMTIPFGKKPPIVKTAENTLEITNRDRVEICNLNDYVLFDIQTGELHVITQSVLREFRENRKPAAGGAPKLHANRGRGRGNGGKRRKHR